MVLPVINVRRAGTADLSAVMAVWMAADGIDGEHDALPLYHHEVATGLMVVAEVEGELTGFGAVLERGGQVFLADLFVSPRQQSRGIGRALLEALFAPWPHLPRYTNASVDPRAQSLYRSFGMEPRFEIDYLRAHGPLHLACDLTSVVGPISGDVVTRDRAWNGVDRSADLAYWAGMGGVAVTASSDGEPVGQGYVFPRTPWVPSGDRTAIGQIVSAPGADPAQVVVAVFAAAAALPDRAEPIYAMIPRPHPAHPLLTAAGMEVFDSDLFMSTDGAGFDPTRRTAAPDIN